MSSGRQQIMINGCFKCEISASATWVFEDVDED